MRYTLDLRTMCCILDANGDCIFHAQTLRTDGMINVSPVLKCLKYNICSPPLPDLDTGGWNEDMVDPTDRCPAAHIT